MAGKHWSVATNKLDMSCFLRKIVLLLILGALSKRKSLQTPSVVTREKPTSLQKQFIP